MKKKIKKLIPILIMVLLFNTVGLSSYASEQVTNSQQKEQQDNSKNIIDIAVGDGRFKTLVAALKAAELEDSLKGQGPFTVFAPTDDAFAKLPENIMKDLLKPGNKENLENILTYHVTPQRLVSEEILKLNGKEIKMLNGKNAKIEVRNNEVYIDGAKIVGKDIIGKNGVIHVIETVMMP
ncbi:MULTISPECIES: fasciclin domain-containing protein [Clostridium]|uniref:Fasciclin domain-containing protein n=1 Tax=Clostridium cibarium TaxID=2762247 RepID=A0ABR8PSP6_9CLOT|nr:MULTISPECIES: fasciclin domain-containing protein [Clostridium]MBD7911187.1 fasciclin domain-containing protein [Clostridium cibarium]